MAKLDGACGDHRRALWPPARLCGRLPANTRYTAKRAPHGRGLVDVALLALGADGGCAGPKDPPNSTEAHAATIAAYVSRAV